jgi:hypothetical protein
VVEAAVERRHLPADHRQLARAALRRGQRGEQLLRIRMLRRAHEIAALGELHDLARVHHGDPVGHARDDAEVVRDEEQRHRALGLKLGEEIQDLGLDRDVERGGRPVMISTWGRPRAPAIIARRLRPPESSNGYCAKRRSAS